MKDTIDNQNDSSTKEDKKIEKEGEDLVTKNVELLEKIAKLEEQLVSNNIKILNYENQLEEHNKTYSEKLKEKMEQANNLVQEKIAKLEEKYSSENHEIKKYGIAKSASEIIEIVDQFKKAINFNTEDAKIKNFLMGFKMFAIMFDSLLSNLNVSEVKVEIGQEFDPAMMEAFDTTNDEKFNDNIVTKVISNAYKLHDRVIKYAVVAVNKK
ncbi:MAG: nucleotide exchange factor GrpE [Mycoplasmataceae bacterium]|jgi:molecular chaperone GrpE|nr:nucleotide exchange factor GrpE [Mycoplasmataceae bacterium]